MAIPKITGALYKNISSWLSETTETVRPNPLKKSFTQTVIRKESDNNKLQQILDGFIEKINVIIDEVNDLIQRVTQNETDISVIETRLDTIDNTLRRKAESAAASVKGHTHIAGQPPGPTGPSLGRKGGSIKKLQRGGRTRPVPRIKQKLIDEIKSLQ